MSLLDWVVSDNPPAVKNATLDGVAVATEAQQPQQQQRPPDAANRVSDARTILVAARSRIFYKARWCQGKAVNRSGYKIDATQALAEAAHEAPPRAVRKACLALVVAMAGESNSCLPRFNDEHEHAVVVGMFTVAIGIAERL